LLVLQVLDACIRSSSASLLLGSMKAHAKHLVERARADAPSPVDLEPIAVQLFNVRHIKA
jgi:hypothetical protein